MADYKLICGDALEVLKKGKEKSIQCCITSPPFFRLRDYEVDGQIGLEETLDEYTCKLVEVFREVRRVLKDDGTLWLNLGDRFNGSGGAGGDYSKGGLREGQTKYPGSNVAGLKPKDLIGVPWRTAFALQEDGWWLRADIVWAKPAPMPESVRDRPVRSHEYIFLLAKNKKYFYDYRAIMEEAAESSLKRIGQKNFQNQTGGEKDYRHGTNPNRSARKILENFAKNPGRNKRDVWFVSSRASKRDHYATYPPELIEPCVLAGSKERDFVLDPFCGSGTTGVVALKNSRRFIGIDLKPEYIEMSEERIQKEIYGKS